MARPSPELKKVHPRYKRKDRSNSGEPNLSAIFLRGSINSLIFIIVVLIEIQLLWVKFNKCILFNDNEGWGFGLAPHIGAVTYTAILSYKLGYKDNS